MNFAISNSKVSLSRKIFKDLYKVFTGTQSARLEFHIPNDSVLDYLDFLQ